nr:site-specific integrase [Granulicella aggregans]
MYKRGGVYWYEFVYEGRRIRESTGVKNQRVAGEIERAYRTALAKGEVGITERKRVPNFREALTDFLRWSAASHKLSSHERYKTSSVALLKHFRDIALDKITPEDVERFKAVRSADKKTSRAADGRRVNTRKRIRPATVNRELACLKALFNFVIKTDVLGKNPVSRVKMLAENNLQTRVLSFTEEHSYLSVATTVLRDVATLMLQTGMRPEEVYRLQPEHVDLSRGYVHVPFGKTAAARRSLRLTAAAREVLARLIAAQSPSPFLFPCESAPERSIPKVNNAHDRAVRDSGIAPIRLYDLRHTWATRAAMSGIDLVTLAAMLGHSKINMVLRYAHPTQGHQADAMERLEKYSALEQIRAFERNDSSALNA